jgi:hypothetical protein
VELGHRLAVDPEPHGACNSDRQYTVLSIFSPASSASILSRAVAVSRRMIHPFDPNARTRRLSCRTWSTVTGRPDNLWVETASARTGEGG